ncbi:hypothetical protein Sj15T_11830 [Sphingobium sp. TA15]|uniref:Surface-adhesin protein E-like domain-containing protein n=1 Tax=Sphingobium indicum (strain DSM 16413 / CCM 7287 / MTCC 6362 / UT26 / NBRC 101211 / UT26S) TaxID=452662 RepID=D4Z296_SPHIU|nr:surface-adhesin E family protein [Sphingobium indicum]BAI96728.1 hypothetical protein SJA_C1-18940 [Sphingobium indicum UT26S]BDD66162.1 hypothetical protein Sj15T_11830 [Sphingobium sp. TA15]
MIVGWALSILLVVSQSEQWEMIGTTNSGVRILVDAGSIQSSGPERTATIRLGSPGSLAGKIVEARQYERFDCATRHWALLGYVAYADDGSVVDHKSPGPAPATMAPVVPDTIGEAVLDFVCTYQPGAAPSSGAATREPN